MTPACRGRVLVCGVALVLSACIDCGGRKKEHVDDSMPVVLGQGGPGDPEHYFPNEVGNQWQFEATATEWGTDTFDFRTTITSTGTRQVAGGATATVFQQVNEDGHNNASEIAFVSDAAGIAAFGELEIIGLGDRAVDAYWELRFPLTPGSTFVQLDRVGLDVGLDLDEDGRNESFDARSTVAVVGIEAVAVPAGNFARCAKVRTSLDLNVVASGTHERLTVNAVSHVWYAPGIGWVRETEDVKVDGEIVETASFELVGYSVNGRSGGQIWNGPPATSVELHPADVDLRVGGSAALNVTAWSGLTPLVGAPIRWHSADPTIAAAGPGGVITAFAPGTTRVWATLDNVRSSDVSVQVLAGRTLSLTANDIVYDPLRGRIYASVPASPPSGVPVTVDSVAVIDPATATIESLLPAGSGPDKLALSGDGRFLYVSLATAEVIRLDLAAPGGPVKDLTFSVGSGEFGGLFVGDMEVMPGAPHTVAIALHYVLGVPDHGAVVVYDDGVPRPIVVPQESGANVIEFSDDPSRLYGLDLEPGRFAFRRMAIDSAGITAEPAAAGLLEPNTRDIEYAAGRLYTTSGVAVDPELGTILGRFASDTYGGSLVEPDLAHGVVYFLHHGIDTHWELSAFDALTWAPRGASTFVALRYTEQADLIRWGTGGIAIRNRYGPGITFVDGLPGVP